jgi:molecular chaperone GrpE
MQKDDLLEEKQLDEQREDGSASPDADAGVGEHAPEKSPSDKNVADSKEFQAEGVTGADVPHRDGDEDTKPSSKPGGGHLKGARKTSKKELLELISRKNNLLKRMGDEIEKHKQELSNKEDKLLRMAAEFENYKKRTRREWELLEQKAKAELITDILGVLDDIDRAFEALGERQDDVAEGVKLIMTGLKDVLKRVGVEEVEALDHRFDPQFHEAVGEVESEDISEGSVAYVVRKGYKLNDILLRPAKVIVSKKKMLHTDHSE